MVHHETLKNPSCWVACQITHFFGGSNCMHRFGELVCFCKCWWGLLRTCRKILGILEGKRWLFLHLAVKATLTIRYWSFRKIIQQMFDILGGLHSESWTVLVSTNLPVMDEKSHKMTRCLKCLELLSGHMNPSCLEYPYGNRSYFKLVKVSSQYQTSRSRWCPMLKRFYHLLLYDYLSSKRLMSCMNAHTQFYNDLCSISAFWQI